MLKSSPRRVAALAAASLLFSGLTLQNASANDLPTVNRPPTNPSTSAPGTRKSIAIPAGLIQGMLLNKVEPQYPAIARATRISGIVKLAATISREGEIINLRVLCGPPLLQDAAQKAVRQWKYKPYLLKGAPVEIETIVAVTFTLGNPKKKPKFSEGSCPVEE